MPDANADSWEQGEPYERYVGRWSRRIAPGFLDWLDIAPDRRWLDVGCGTGALSAAILERASPTSVVAVEPSEGFRATASANLGSRVQLHGGTAGDLPLADASVDVVVSALMLNFVPDPAAAIEEMTRVTADDGTVSAYVWDYADGMQLIRHFWDAAVELDVAARALDEGRRFPICRADALRHLFERSSLSAIDVTALTVPTIFPDFDDCWQPFLGGQGPAPAYASALAPDAQAALRELLRARLPTGADGSIALQARAWAVRGRVARSDR